MTKDKKQNSKPRYSEVPDYSKKDAEPARTSREELKTKAEIDKEFLGKAGLEVPPQDTDRDTSMDSNERVIPKCSSSIPDGTTTMEGLEVIEAIDGALATDSNPVTPGEIAAIPEGANPNDIQIGVPGEMTSALLDRSKVLQVEVTSHSIRLMQSRAGRELLCGDKVIAAELDRSPKWKLVCPVCGLYVVAGMDRRNNAIIVEYERRTGGSMEPLITNDR